MNKVILTTQNIPGFKELKFDKLESLEDANKYIDILKKYDEIIVLNMLDLFNLIKSKFNEDSLKISSQYLIYISYLFSKSEPYFLEEYDDIFKEEEKGIYSDKVKIVTSVESIKFFDKSMIMDNGDTKYNIIITQRDVNENNFALYLKAKLEDYDILKIV